MKPLLKFFSSLQLTVILLIASVALVFFGTLDQARYGIYQAQHQYFEHVVALWHYPEQWPAADVLGWLQLPIPGGYLIGPLLIVNLICAHFRYFRASWKKLGIVLIHSGVTLLLIGQLWTQIKQDEYFLWLNEGTQKNFVEHFYDNEIVVIEKDVNGQDLVTAWPVKPLSFRDRPVLRSSTLPFHVQVLEYFPNAIVQSRAMTPEGASDAAQFYQVDRGIVSERDLTVLPARVSYQQGAENWGTAIVELQGPGGQPLGRWVVSEAFRQERPMIMWFPPQVFEYNGKTYEIALRKERQYLPASIELVDFSHDRYPGTEVPYNFSSDVRIHEEGRDHARDARIYMNHPLRYEGLTFYQASFADADTASMFQVVRNPAQAIPYISCILVTIGLLFQFILGLFQGVIRRRKTETSQA
ncbi:MAG: cytochrome c biogenesis protein ResB [Verrucomicrobiota bacterium JB022]|nr:cytochrome c biogenesis protein ResB [Verrucomicrobiota bacterium JB022]